MGDAADPRDGKRTFIVPAIKPFDHYDFSRAKIACNLAWLVAKAFGTGRRWPSVPPSPAAASIPVLFPSSVPPRPGPRLAPRLARRAGSGTRWALRAGERRWVTPACPSVKSLRFGQVGCARFPLLDSRSGCLLFSFFFPLSSDQFCHAFTRGGFNIWYFPHCAAFVSPAVIAVITAPRNLSWFRYYWKEVAGTQTTLTLTFVTMAASQAPRAVRWPAAECRFLDFVVLL